MRKGRYSILLIYFLISVFAVYGQNDTLKRYGFKDHNEAGDSLFARFLAKKYAGILVFALEEKRFLSETRKHDTVVSEQMVQGMHLAYCGKLERTYKKVYKRLRKQKVRVGKTVLDTVLLYRNTGIAEVHRAELYLSQKKYNAYVKFQLWQVDGLWYFSGKFELVEEKVKL